ncbi:MAG TPA: PilZ domain-containing protein [Thermoanaerobaculia bacterium]|nr:PilZ domain-containing protein [Thermoanaerobaculia bacterium]
MSRDRRVQRVRLSLPATGRFGANAVVVVDISVLGARIEHHTALGTAAGSSANLSFVLEDEQVSVECRVVRSRLERFSVGTDGLTVYHSGLEFLDPMQETRIQLKRIIGRFIVRALEEQKANARGLIPTSVEKMPIFRHGQLTENRADVAEAIGSSVLPTARVAKETGYICLQLEKNRNWKKKRTHDPGQPVEGFTVSAAEDQSQIEMLCDAYARSDGDGRKLIQLFAQLSIIEGEGIAPGRFQP